jgi:hypothetical protein
MTFALIMLTISALWTWFAVWADNTDTLSLFGVDAEGV